MPRVLDSQSFEDWKLITHDPLPNIYYVSPDTTLPQIMQLLNADPSQSGAIIVVQNTSYSELSLMDAQASLLTEHLKCQDPVTTLSFLSDPSSIDGSMDPSSKACPMHATQYANDYLLGM
ncbi:hypothetical protein BJX96DRAFT_141692 [Aspergillus floccosus]